MFSHAQLVERHIAIEEITLPSIPPVVNVDQLDSNLRLIPTHDYERLKRSNLPGGHIHKPDSGCLYTLIVMDDDIYAIYSGNQYELGSGACGHVKAAQNLRTGTWAACKVIEERNGYNKDTINEEAALLSKMHQLASPDVRTITYQSRRRSTETKYAILMKYIKGVELHNVTITNTYEALSIYISAMQAFLDLFDNKINYHDMKSAHIIYDFLTQESHIVDFGYSTCGEASLPEKINKIGYVSRIIENVISFKCSNLVRNNSLMHFKEDLLPAFIEQLNASTNPVAITHQFINELKEIKAKLPREDKTYKVGILDIRDFDPQNHLDIFTGFSEIWITDSSQSKDQRGYLKCRQHLSRHRINVNDVVLKHPSRTKIASRIKHSLDERLPGCPVEIDNVVAVKKHSDTQEKGNTDSIKGMRLFAAGTVTLAAAAYTMYLSC